MKQWVYIRGALSTKLGDEGNYIARSSLVEKHHLEEIEKKDILLRSYFENAGTANNDDQETLYANFYVYTGDQKELLVIRAQKKFTTFLDMGRAYHRREYFFFRDDKELNPVNCIRSLPAMIQFSEYDMNYNPEFKISDEKRGIDAGFLSQLLQALLIGRDSRLTIHGRSANENEEILRSINTLPTIYLRHLQIGLNFGTSNPLETQVQVLTGGGTSNLREAESDITKLAEEIIDDTSWYDEREINARKETDTVLSLARYHQLAYYLKHQKVPNNRETIISDLQGYMRRFYKPEYAQNEKINERTRNAWQLLLKESAQDPALFDFAWDLVLASGDKTPHLSGFGDLNERLIPLVAEKMGSIQEIENNYSRLSSIQINGSTESVTSLIVTKYIETRSLGANDMKQVLDLLEKGRTFNKKSIAEKIDDTLLQKLEGEGLRLLKVFGADLPMSTLEPLVKKSIGSLAMYAYANSEKDFFKELKLVTACEDFMHFQQLNDKGIKQSLDWAILYQNNRKELRIGQTDAENTLKQVDLKEWNQFLLNVELAKALFPDLKEASVVKHQMLKHIDDSYLPQSLAEYVKNKNSSKLAVDEDIPYAKTFAEFRENYKRIRNHKGLFRLGSLRKFTTRFIEEYDFSKNPETAVEFILLVEPDDYSTLEDHGVMFKEVLSGTGLPPSNAKKSSRFINTVILGNKDQKSSKKKDNPLMQKISRYGLWIVSGVLAAGLTYAILLNSQQKAQLEERNIQIKIISAQIDSLAKKRVPVQQIFIRMGKPDTLAAYKLTNADSLIYSPSGNK